jgi:hypothetical protein
MCLVKNLSDAMKKTILYKLLVTAVLLIKFILPAFSQDSLHFVDLVKRLYDMEYLATPPNPGEMSGNFSSFDRRSRYDSSTNTYVAWGANGDGSGYIRKEGDDMVVFEKEGPGVMDGLRQCLWQRTCSRYFTTSK